MHEWTDDLMEVVTDWLRVNALTVDDDTLEELRFDIADTLNWKALEKMSAMMGGRV